MDLQWPGPSRVPSGAHLQWSGPFGSSFRLVGSYTPFGFTKILQSGRGVGGTLNTRAGCGRGVPAAQLVGRRSWRRGQTAGGGSIPHWSTGKPQVVTRRKATGAAKKSSGLWEVPSRDSSS